MIISTDYGLSPPRDTDGFFKKSPPPKRSPHFLDSFAPIAFVELENLFLRWTSDLFLLRLLSGLLPFFFSDKNLANLNYLKMRPSLERFPSTNPPKHRSMHLFCNPFLI